jgi:hypothetical protein
MSRTKRPDYNFQAFLGDRLLKLNIERVKSVDYLPYKDNLGILIIEFFPPESLVNYPANGNFLSLIAKRQEVKKIKNMIKSHINNGEGNHGKS